MMVCKRILAGLTFLLCVAGLLLSLTGGIGVWVVKEPATAKATKVFGRIEAALDVADQGLVHVQSSLDKAEERLASVKEEQRKLAQDPRNNRPLGRVMARTVQQTVAPEFDNAHETFHTVAEAAVVVNSILEDVGNFPFLSIPGLEGDDLTAINSSLSQVESSSWELARLFGEPDSDAEAASNEMTRIERALKTLRGMLADYKNRVSQVRQRTEELKSRTFRWITPGSIIISAVCFWIALSQLSLMSHACSWWKHAGRRNGSVP
jgi:flagellar biosynthesis chaperone FliJ